MILVKKKKKKKNHSDSKWVKKLLNSDNNHCLVKITFLHGQLQYFVLSNLQMSKARVTPT